MLEVGGNSPRAPKLSPGIKCACCYTKDNYMLRDDSTLCAHYYNIPMESHTICTLQTYVQAYIHGSDVILIGFSDFLHDLRFSLTTAINGSFDSDSSLLVVQ